MIVKADEVKSRMEKSLAKILNKARIDAKIEIISLKVNKKFTFKLQEASHIFFLTKTIP